MSIEFWICDLRFLADEKPKALQLNNALIRCLYIVQQFISVYPPQVRLMSVLWLLFMINYTIFAHVFVLPIGRFKNVFLYLHLDDMKNCFDLHRSNEAQLNNYSINHVCQHHLFNLFLLLSFKLLLLFDGVWPAKINNIKNKKKTSVT